MSRVKRTLDWRFLLTLVILGALAWFMLNSVSSGARDRQDLRHEIEMSEKRADAADKALAEQQSAAEALEAQVRSLGERPVIEPSPSSSVAAERRVVVIEGRRGLSCIEEIGLKRCRGNAGENGEDGETITGPQGPTGPVGPQGPPPACAPNCKGEPGKDATFTETSAECLPGEYVRLVRLTDTGKLQVICEPAGLLGAP